MKLTLTTAIAAALISTGAMAETASRGDDNQSGAEVVDPNAKLTIGEQVEANQASRGADNITAEEAANSPLIANEEVEGIENGVDNQSRGEGNLSGAEVTAKDEKKGY
ncbi:hypothetical protein ACXYMO_02180 [Arenibacterium sp. CAU 1754]